MKKFKLSQLTFTTLAVLSLVACQKGQTTSSVVEEPKQEVIKPATEAKKTESKKDGVDQKQLEQKNAKEVNPNMKPPSSSSQGTEVANQQVPAVQEIAQAQTDQQVIEQETAQTNQKTSVQIDYSFLAGTWRDATGLEVVYNEQGEVLAYDGVPQQNWVPSVSHPPYYDDSAWVVLYQGSYTAILPAGSTYSNGIDVSNEAESVDRIVMGNGVIDFGSDEVFYRVQ